ncbi:F-box/FBD/LRR-repeat protein At1g13570-like [Lycium ferocissimum]|uniref:F-box/FBD/LRR-repeat protein At1g13570-like n=1 Tax=Lycium ferocissimum TaxID=112874 RepID=UPI00281592B2|nr:F-box/FBD/LRR-repeat protein At1g13570-like [Lycium ferocissimum]
MSTQDKEIADVEGSKEDRISALPRDIILYILMRLPTEDAAKTSILSKNWRYIWTMLPNLVLDSGFWDKLAVESPSIFKQTVDDILLVHLGDIGRFYLHIPTTPLPSHADIDRWMLHVTRNGVEFLYLNMPRNTIYKVPSSVFNCRTLTHLELCNCVFKPPNSFLGFHNLTILYLEDVTIVPTTDFCVIDVPHLFVLELNSCAGTQYLKIISPKLETLVFRNSHYFVLNCFVNCKILRMLQLTFNKEVSNLEHDQRSTVEKLLFSLAPTIEILYLDSVGILSFLLELLNADTFPMGPPFALNCLWYLSLFVDFGKLSETSRALQLIKSAPNLSKLEILLDGTNENDEEAVSKYLNSPACLDRPLNKLKHVVIHWFEGAKTELLFIKLLFARTPFLERMSIRQGREFGSREESNIFTELICFPKASPKAELYLELEMLQDLKIREMLQDSNRVLLAGVLMVLTHFASLDFPLLIDTLTDKSAYESSYAQLVYNVLEKKTPCTRYFFSSVQALVNKVTRYLCWWEVASTPWNESRCTQVGPEALFSLSRLCNYQMQIESTFLELDLADQSSLEDVTLSLTHLVV